MSSPSSEEPDERPDLRSALRPGPLPLYQLILHRSGDHDLMRTLRTIMELTRFGWQEATEKIAEAENQGRCQLLVTHKERAELFAELFTNRKLPVSIERA
jgi:hypothetical protein